MQLGDRRLWSLFCRSNGPAHYLAACRMRRDLVRKPNCLICLVYNTLQLTVTLRRWLNALFEKRPRFSRPARGSHLTSYSPLFGVSIRMLWCGQTCRLPSTLAVASSSSPMKNAIPTRFCRHIDCKDLLDCLQGNTVKQLTIMRR